MDITWLEDEIHIGLEKRDIDNIHKIVGQMGKIANAQEQSSECFLGYMAGILSFSAKCISSVSDKSREEIIDILADMAKNEFTDSDNEQKDNGKEE